MSQSSSSDSNQRTNISDTSVEGQVSQAGRDSTQLQGKGNIYKDVTITNIYNQEAGENCQLTRQEYLNRRALLTKVKNFWVEGVLKKSLHEQVLITLGLEARSDAVTTPWTVVLTEAEKPSISLPQETQVITLFDELGAGRTLLILGEPGAGKTITLLQLADALITRAEQDINHLIPVVFNLSSWSPQLRKGKRQPHLVTIAEWLIEELGSKYQVPRKIGKAWVKQQQLLLLLDGLDEVRPEYREDCVRALNAFQEEIGTETVVCCRRKDYESLSVRFNFQRAIFLKPLTPEQVRNYLNQLETNLTGLKTLLDKDVALQELAQSPLTLSMMVLAYQGLNVEDLPKPALVRERRKQLFDTYIERMLEWRGRDRRYTSEKTIYWLSWLARRMVENSQTIFLIERIQPDWLQTKREIRIYILFILLLDVPIICIIIGVIILLSGNLDLAIVLLTYNPLLISQNYPLKLGTKNKSNEDSNPSCGRTRTTSKKRNYELFNWISIACILGITIGLISLLLGKWDISIIILSLVKLISSLQKLSTEIKPAEKLNFSWARAKNILNRELVGWSLSILAGILFVLLILLITGLISAQFFGLISELFLGYIALIVLFSGLNVSELEVTAVPNQGIRNSVKNSIIFGLLSLLISGLLAWATGGFPAWLILGLIAGLIAGLPYGGEASIQHLTLRLTLYQQGFAPWNYAQFLDHVIDRLFLQRVGGGYIFVHRLLMEHFAAMDVQQNKNRV